MREGGWGVRGVSRRGVMAGVCQERKAGRERRGRCTQADRQKGRHPDLTDSTKRQRGSGQVGRQAGKQTGIKAIKKQARRQESAQPGNRGASERFRAQDGLTCQ